jgi:CheY-like chemotaxis protein
MNQEITPSSPPARKKRILYIEDEQIVINVTKQILEYLGFEVDVLMQSREAISLLKTQSEDYDLIITDMNMPHMNGIELSKILLEIRPDIPIILCTGSGNAIDEEEIRALGIKGILPKPFLITDIIKITNSILT